MHSSSNAPMGTLCRCYRPSETEVVVHFSVDIQRHLDALWTYLGCSSGCVYLFQKRSFILYILILRSDLDRIGCAVLCKAVYENTFHGVVRSFPVEAATKHSLTSGTAGQCLLPPSW